MDINLNDLLKNIKLEDYSFIENTKKEAENIGVGSSAWTEKSGFKNEYEYKKSNANNGNIMYHVHFCFRDFKQFDNNTKELAELLKEKGLKLDRFGVSIDSSMALPRELRNDEAKHVALYFKDQNDWDYLSCKDVSQVHLGDNMIGSPASYDSCVSALKAGITTMGNISQYFGWDYEEFPDNKKRTENTIKAICAMAVHKNDGALIHSNLDDGYGADTTKIYELLGMAILEKYIVCDLLGANLAPSFGDDFHSPYKRLVMLSALNSLYEGKLIGSMLFENKLGRASDITLNDAHLSECLLFDMAGQIHYKTGHAVTVMADSGLNEEVTAKEIVRKLELAKELESYAKEVCQTIDFNHIDKVADRELENGHKFANAVLDMLKQYIDTKNPYELMLAIKTIGVKNLCQMFNFDENDSLTTDFNLYKH